MLTNTLQHINEIVIRIDVMQSACHQQALHDANVPGAEFGPAEQPISATHRNHPQGAFQMVGIDRHISRRWRRAKRLLHTPGRPARVILVDGPRPAPHHAGHEADIGAAAINHTNRGGWARQDLRVVALDGPGPRPVASLGLPRRPATYRPHIFEDHVAAGALCQAVTNLLATTPSPSSRRTSMPGRV